MCGCIGADVSQATTQAMWETLLGTYPFRFAVVEAYWPSGPNPNARTSIDGARAAGITHVDVYHFPGPFSGVSPNQQIEASTQQLKSLSFHHYWIDVEPYAQTWGTDTAHNVKMLAELILAAQARRLSVGVYTSASAWAQITGSTTRFADLPLWYYHWDAQDNFDDFQAFGGWTAPTMKQYFGNGNLDGVGYDANWIPSLPRKVERRSPPPSCPQS
ncbi:MAG: hypothetical protein H6739_23525 [Alphaproteobacteria bacterium]|nr:hypothetical protein [Alphaproteobacteria bacterium]